MSDENTDQQGVHQDDVEGHMRTRATDDDVQGHGLYHTVVDADDDVEGHLRARATDDEDDVAGHMVNGKTIPAVGAEDEAFENRRR